MGKFLKNGKVVVLLAGRYAGKKAIVVRAYEEGNAEGRKFAHALVAGIDRYPRRVTKSMKSNPGRIKKRTTIKPFVKHVNFNHLMPTRYQLNDMDLKKVIDENKVNEGGSKEINTAVKKVFEDRYRDQTSSKSAKNRDGAKYFFKKLRF